MRLGYAIKLWRVRRDMMQSQLAKATGLSVSYLSLVERDKRDLTVSKMVKIADALELPVTVLIATAEGPGKLPAGITDALARYIAWDETR